MLLTPANADAQNASEIATLAQRIDQPRHPTGRVAVVIAKSSAFLSRKASKITEPAKQNLMPEQEVKQLLRRLEAITFRQARNFDLLDARIVPHISNRKIASMENKFTLISRLAIIAIVAGSLSVIGTGRAQEDTSIGSNPHLRAQSAPTPPSGNVKKMSEKDVSFIQKAGGGGQQEVENGKMAEKQGKSADVKRIGARMAADHTRMNKELTALAKGKGVTFNTGGVKAQDLGTADFDRQYLMLLEATHKKDIADFEREAKSGDDPELKAWASKTLPTLKEHLAMVKSAMKQ